MKMRVEVALLSAAAIALSGCEPSQCTRGYQGDPNYCEKDSDCPSQNCVFPESVGCGGLCSSTPRPDSGLPEAGPSDARHAEARPPDGHSTPDLPPAACTADKLLVLEDKDFLDGDWSFEKHAAHSSGTSSFVVSNKDGTGAPLGYQATEMKLESLGQIWVSHFYKTTLKPKDRPIASIRATLSGRAVQSNGNVGVGPQLVQGQKTFRAGYSLLYTGQGWVTAGGEFVPVSTGDALDLGTTGEEIKVGYMTAIAVVDTRRMEVDNWRLEVCFQ